MWLRVVVAVLCGSVAPEGARLTRTAVLRSAVAATSALVPTVVHSVPPPELLARAPEAPAQLRQQAEPKVLYTPPSVKGLSSPEQVQLAEHLSKTGAKFYGAYWCSFCRRQRDMFGAGGARALPYVECAEDGFRSQRCPPQVTGYPAWQINGKFYSGMRTLQDLQSISDFDSSVKFAEYVPPPPPPRPPPPPGGYKPPVVDGKSTAEQLALARHLKASGAKFYGAYWCRYCGVQRTMFGAEATVALPYVECAEDGYQSASAVCRTQAQVTAYPTWQIGGQFYSGARQLDELAKLSGFDAKPQAAAKVAAVAPPTEPTQRGASNDLGIDFGGNAPVLRTGDDCDLQREEDCK